MLSPPKLLALFVVANVVVVFTPPVLKFPFPPFPLVKIGDMVDLLSPFIICPLYWMLYEFGHGDESSSRAVKREFRYSDFLFYAFVGLVGESFGMHLGANSVGHILKDHSLHKEPSLVWDVNDFYDEFLSHYLGQVAVMGVCTCLTYHHWSLGSSSVNVGAGKKTDRQASQTHPLLPWSSVAIGAVHGFTYWVFVVESGTCILSIPWCIAYLSWAYVAIAGRGRNERKSVPYVIAFFVGKYTMTLALSAWWSCCYPGRFPEFSELGYI